MASTLYESEMIYVAKITLNRFDGGASKTVYCSTRYFAPGELISGDTNIIYPLMVRPPALKRSMGRVTNNITEFALTLHGTNDVDDLNESFYDLRHTYEFQDADVEIRAYARPRGGAVTHADATHIQIIARIAGYSFERDQLRIRCKDSLFVDRIISKSLNTDDYSELQADFIEQPLSYVFGEGASGEGVIIDAPLLKTPGTGQFNLFAGWNITDHEISDIVSFHGRNNFPNISPRPWITLKTTGFSNILSANVCDATVHYTDLTGGTADRSIKDWHIAMPITVTSDDDGIFLMFGAAKLLDSGGGSANEGNVFCAIYQRDTQATPETPLEPPIATKIVPSTFLSVIAAQIQTAWFNLVLPKGDYFVVWGYSNPNATKDIYVVRHTNGAYSFIRRVRSTDREAAWDSYTGQRIKAGALTAEFPTTISTETVNNKFLAYVDMDYPAGASYTLEDVTPPPFKLGVEGMTDDGSGTYTGVASELINEPADIAYFLLEHSTFLDIDSGDIDQSSFTGARSAMSGLEMSFATVGEFSVGRLLYEVLEQSMSYIYKSKLGKLTFKYTEYVTAQDNTISETYYEDDLKIVAEYETDAADIVNDLSVYYGVNALNIPQDAARNNARGNTAFLNVYELNGTDSTDSDSHREAKMSLSETAYGRREMFKELNKYASDSNAPLTYAKNRADRLHKKLKITTFMAPAKKWSDVDYFDTFSVRHTDLPCDSSHNLECQAFNDGQELNFIRDGILIAAKVEGERTGETLAITFADQDIEITIEEVLPY